MQARPLLAVPYPPSRHRCQCATRCRRRPSRGSRPCIGGWRSRWRWARRLGGLCCCSPFCSSYRSHGPSSPRPGTTTTSRPHPQTVTRSQLPHDRPFSEPKRHDPTRQNREVALLQRGLHLAGFISINSGSRISERDTVPVWRRALVSSVSYVSNSNFSCFPVCVPVTERLQDKKRRTHGREHGCLFLHSPSTAASGGSAA